MKEVSFWTPGPYIEGMRTYIRVVLTEDEPFSWSEGAPTDEGYSSSQEYYFWDGGDTVGCTVTSDGADCDGRHSSRRTYNCPVADLATNDNGNGISTPTWERIHSSQRDYRAEAAGY